MKDDSTSIANYFVKHKAKNLCVNAKGELLTYLDVYQKAIKPPFTATNRQLVFCIVENEISALSGYFALLVANAVPMMVAVTISTEKLHHLASSYRPHFIWLPEARRKEFERADCMLSQDGYCLLNLHNPERRCHDSLALLLATSGSTGNPKYVRLSHRNLYSNAESIAKFLELTSNEVPITTLPPSYSYGLSIIHSHIFVGATLAITNKTFFDRDFWNFFHDIQATSMGGVPYHYEMLKKLRFTSMNLPSLRTLTQAGGGMDTKLTMEYASYCESSGRRFFSMYGQTEATARMSYLPSSEATFKAGSIGIAIPGGKFWLEDKSGQIFDCADSPGELVYQGPNVSMGYADSYEDLEKSDERHGVLRTGDIARRDGDGYYFIVGRRKRFIKLYGNRVSLSDIDGLLFESGYVAACAGQDNYLEVYALNIDAEKAKLVKKLVVGSLHIAQSAVSVYGVTEFPRSDSGKIQYSELQSQLGILLT